MQYKAQRLYITASGKVQYLESLITSDGRSINEIKIRIARGKKAFQDPSTILGNRHISIKIRNGVLESYTVPVLTNMRKWVLDHQQCRCQCHQCSRNVVGFLKNAKIIVRRENYQWRCATRRAETGRKLCVKIREGQARFFGHVMRRDGLETSLQQGWSMGKRAVEDNVLSISTA